MTLQTLAFWGFAIIGAIILGFATLILWRIYTGAIELTGLLLEPESTKASLSRFQFLIFTFVFAGLFLILCIEAGTFVDIPTNVLALLGISSGSYVLSKAMGKPTAPPGTASSSATRTETRTASHSERAT
jgi:hypothetical protein